MNSHFTYLPYLVFLGGLCIIGLIILLSQLDKSPTDAELTGRSLPDKDEAENNVSDPAFWPAPGPYEYKTRAHALIQSQRDELLFQP